MPTVCQLAVGQPAVDGGGAAGLHPLPARRDGEPVHAGNAPVGRLSADQPDRAIDWPGWTYSARYGQSQPLWPEWSRSGDGGRSPLTHAQRTAAEQFGTGRSAHPAGLAGGQQRRTATAGPHARPTGSEPACPGHRVSVHDRGDTGLRPRLARTFYRVRPIRFRLTCRCRPARQRHPAAVSIRKSCDPVHVYAGRRGSTHQ